MPSCVIVSVVIFCIDFCIGVCGVVKSPKVIRRSAELVFEDRLRREGRYDDFMVRANTLVRDGSMNILQARRSLKEEFGYKGPTGEHAIEDVRLASEASDSLEMRRRLGYNPSVPSTDQALFESKIASLPLEAEDLVEMNWLRRHPAIVRGSNTKSGTGTTVITLSDVFDSPAGPSPSQRCVYDLIYWSNHPTEFRKTVITAQRKRIESTSTSGSGPSGLECEDDLSMVEALLERFSLKDTCPYCDRSLPKKNRKVK